MRLEQVLLRLMLSAALAFFGAWLGHVAAALLWDFIYAIGSRVVSDDLYGALLDDVPSWGRIAGACSGFAVGLLPRFWPLAAFPLLHVVSLLAGAVGGSLVWWAGLTGYLGVHAVAVVASCFFLATRALRSVAATSGRGQPTPPK